MSFKNYSPKASGYRNFVIIVLCSLLLFSCSEEQNPSNNDNTKTREASVDLSGFELMTDEHTGITFENTLTIEELKSFVYYINVFNGGGVALGDINNDELIDIYLTGNMVGNKLYLNKGNMQFEDITEKAGVACNSKWSNGASFADVNNDGLLDLYVCHAYDDDNEQNRANSLFINQGDNTFSDQAKEYGVDDVGYSIHVAFLDYDKDGHLDMFVGNTPRWVTGDFYFNDTYNHFINFKEPKNPLWSDKLYKNNGDGSFSDVTRSAGLFNYGYMLGVSVADYNNDGWDDIFVAVDHGTPDYLYINNGDGSFRNEIYDAFKHISLSSMGTDAADLNNDSKIDLVTLDMLSIDNFNEKTQMGSMDPKNFEERVNNGLHYQYMRNMLQLNQGNGQFTEIGQLAGIHKSDWSWSVIAADFSNNGYKDLYVTNGVFRSMLDKDITKKFRGILKSTDPSKHKDIAKQLEVNYLKPQENKNVLFRNNGDYTFTDVANEVGCDQNGFSSGAAYADLDNDGDLDLVVNNVNQIASILRNKQRENGEGNYLQIDLQYKTGIPSAGTKIEILSCDQNQYYEATYSRGYQSAYTGPIHVGLAKCEMVEQLKIIWPDGKIQLIDDVSANQKISVAYDPSSDRSDSKVYNAIVQLDMNKVSPSHKHMENKFDDYEYQVLLPHKMSQFGPSIAAGDVNKDGYEDFFVGAAKGQAGSLYLFDVESKQYLQQGNYFDDHQEYEDMGSTFLDIDNDGDLDLYVVSGGNEYEVNSDFYRDRVYLNNGSGEFAYSEQSSPELNLSGSCVELSDYDNDGYMDLFVGTRHKPRSYPFSSPSYILKNNNGKLEIAQELFGASEEDMAMVTDASFVDINNDDQQDLIVVGEWMPVTVFINQKGKFVDQTEKYNLSDTEGWWNCIEKADLDGDGDLDFVLGNLGLNYKYQATKDKPFHVYAGDFDENGKSDIVLGQYYVDALYPVRGRQCSSEQLPSIAKKFPSYNAFGSADLETVYSEYILEAYHLKVSDFKSSVLMNNGKSFSLNALPQEAQFSPINAVVFKDLNGDDLLDIIAGGNLYVSEVETGRADGGVGVVLLQKENGGFESISSDKTGLMIDKDVKSLILINNDGLLVGNNNDELQFYTLSSSD